jgi:serine/threonine protein phosphatase PrpC
VLRVAEQYAGTDTGRQRRANEDSLLARSPLFVVADGMGGAQAGEVASRIAVESFQPGLPDAREPELALAELARAANARIHELSHSNAEHAGMGTTLTAAYVGEDEIAIAHVGDSRAYCMRDGELVRLTDDHSLVDELMRQGRLTPEEAVEHPQRSVITRALGPEGTVEVDTRSFRARAGDVYLLCSDGLTTMVPEATIAEVLAGNERLRDAGEALIAAANEAGGRDNITVLLLRVEEVQPGEPPSREHDTIVGAPALAPPSPPTRGTRVRTPRAPADRPLAPAARRRRIRRAGALVGVLAVLGVIGAAAYLALQQVYFIGTNSRGLVTIYRGVPFSLPASLSLYSSDYVSGVGASTLTPARRHTLLDHSLRSEKDAASLITSLELDQLE